MLNISVQKHEKRWYACVSLGSLGPKMYYYYYFNVTIAVVYY